MRSAIVPTFSPKSQSRSGVCGITIVSAPGQNAPASSAAPGGTESHNAHACRGLDIRTGSGKDRARFFNVKILAVAPGAKGSAATP